MLRSLFVIPICFCPCLTDGDEPMRVDPLLVRQAETVWKLIAAKNNRIWPGWDATDTPIMIYLPDVQEILINHPAPSKDFKRYKGPISFLGHDIWVHSGKTLIKDDGQNTSIKVFDTPTLVVADTLSNRRNSIRGLIGSSASNREKMASLRFSSLRADPYDQMATVAHEAFHVFQMRELNHPFAKESHVRLYPCLSVANNVGFALEASALIDCAESKDEQELRSAAIRWLAIRLDRRKTLPKKAIDYEDSNEFIEGIAKYVEVKLMEELQGKNADPALWLAQGFHGFDDLAWFREDALSAVGQFMRGEVPVNNDPYGTAPVRFRLYYSGMAIAMLLDRIAPDWKAEISNSQATLTSIAQRALNAKQSELDAALQAARSGPDYKDLVARKTDLAKRGAADTEEMRARILEGPNTLLLLDYSEVPDEELSLTFTAFGVRAINSERAMYSMVPLSARLHDGDYSFTQSEPIAAIHARDDHFFKMRLTQSMSPDQLAGLLERNGDGPWTLENLAVDLPGVSVKAKRATIGCDGRTVRVKFLSK